MKCFVKLLHIVCMFVNSKQLSMKYFIIELRGENTSEVGTCVVFCMCWAFWWTFYILDSMVQGHVFLKGGRGWHFSYLIYSRFIIFTFRNYFTLCKTVLCIWIKIIFFCHHNFMKKVILSCLKMNLKLSHKLR